MSIDEIHIGAEVYWNDPDEGICSGYYTVVEIISDEIVRLRNDQGSELEAFVSELS